ncbi:MAG: glutathione S-transferase N-terminal domain-containing protein, partial [Rubritepida sp.]|nr:glutathione S-transferase N-terminal domain-containing protein [Rubritepida sp.]
MLTVLGRVNSSNVMKVLWCLDELGMEYQRFDAGMEHGVVDTPEYRAKNPNGRIPTIEDAGETLWESNSCMRY